MARPQLGTPPSRPTDAIRRGDLWASLDPTAPAGAIATTMRRTEVNSAAYTPLTSGRLAMFALRLFAGDTVSNINVMSGSTAGASLTRAWFALYDANRNLLGQTATDSAATWAANTVKALALTPYVVTASGLFYVGVMVQGTTMPSLMGSASIQSGALGVAPIDVGTSNTGLTTTAPNPANALSNNIGGKAWIWLT